MTQSTGILKSLIELLDKEGPLTLEELREKSDLKPTKTPKGLWKLKSEVIGSIGYRSLRVWYSNKDPGNIERAKLKLKELTEKRLESFERAKKIWGPGNLNCRFAVLTLLQYNIASTVGEITNILQIPKYNYDAARRLFNTQYHTYTSLIVLLRNYSNNNVLARERGSGRYHPTIGEYHYKLGYKGLEEINTIRKKLLKGPEEIRYNSKDMYYGGELVYVEGRHDLGIVLYTDVEHLDDYRAHVLLSNSGATIKLSMAEDLKYKRSITPEVIDKSIEEHLFVKY